LRGSRTRGPTFLTTNERPIAGLARGVSEANGYLDSTDRYETALVAAHRNPRRASNGIRMVADLTFEEAAGGFDIILVAGAPIAPEAVPEPCLVRWVKELPWRSSTSAHGFP
jgi:transcriptional regulator GlxA family with amidase domain